MNKKIFYITSFLIFISIPCFLSPANQIKPESYGNIIIEFTNFNTDNGFLLVGLYNNAKGFPSTTESMIMRIKVKIQHKKATAEFDDVPYGVYAISGYQDENKNGKLDTGMFKIPKEALIVSNNAKGKFGPAKFEDAKFELKSNNLKLKIKAQFY